MRARSVILQGCCGLLDWPIGDITPRRCLETFQNTFLEGGEAGDPLGKFLSNDQEILPAAGDSRVVACQGQNRPEALEAAQRGPGWGSRAQGERSSKLPVFLIPST